MKLPFEKQKFLALTVAACLPLMSAPLQAETDCTLTQIQQECEALIDLYKNTDGPNWENNTGWNMTNEPCDWFGIECDTQKKHVQSIIMGMNKLKGSLPSSWENLSQLKKLILIAHPQLSGSLPSSLGNWEDPFLIGWGI